MTKSSTKTRKTVKVSGVEIKATRVRRRKVVEAPVAEVAPAVIVAETPAPAVVEAIAEAQNAEAAIFVIPDIGPTDLVVSREGFPQLPGKTWYSLSKAFGKESVRQAIAAMTALDLRLPVAMELATWPGFRPHMVGQLQAVAANKDVLNVLGWVWAHQGFTWREAYEAFPRAGFPGCAATKAEIGKLNKLVGLLDRLRKEGKTSVSNLDFLAQACHLIGWIK